VKTRNINSLDRIPGGKLLHAFFEYGPESAAGLEESARLMRSKECEGFRHD
jgi:hypothetical protein